MRPLAFFHTPRVDRGLGPVGGSTKGPPNPHFGTPLTRIVALAPYGGSAGGPISAHPSGMARVRPEA